MHESFFRSERLPIVLREKYLKILVSFLYAAVLKWTRVVSPVQNRRLNYRNDTIT